MDVRCERCKTDYEFDDARITEAGVTVKCTTCGHVFKVKKKALVVTVPVRPGEMDQAHAPLTQTPVSAGHAVAHASPGVDRSEKPKEWKVRQGSGNVFNFKELTTLQKWIVERKVTRDDEISLTGESWKRLGNIAELASFFQVVDEATKGAQLAAFQAQPVPPPPAAPPPAHATPMAFAAATPPSQAVTQPALSVFISPSQEPSVPHTNGVTPNGRAPTAPNGRHPEPAFTQPSGGFTRSDFEDEPPDKLRGGMGKWIALVAVLFLLGAGGFAGYAYYWQPMQLAKAQARDAAIKADEAARLQREKDEAEKAEKAKADAEAEAAAKKKAEAAAVTVDAGIQAASAEDGPSAVAAKGKREPHNFDWFMAQGDKLRERERAEAALDAYGSASELEPDRPEPIAGRGLALLDMGSKLQAEAAFEQALKVDPHYSVAIMGLAEAFRAQGKNADALKYYQRYLDVSPGGSEAAVARAAIKKLQE